VPLGRTDSPAACTFDVEIPSCLARAAAMVSADGRVVPLGRIACIACWSLLVETPSFWASVVMSGGPGCVAAVSEVPPALVDAVVAAPPHPAATASRPAAPSTAIDLRMRGRIVPPWGGWPDQDRPRPCERARRGVRAS
jgi:hypothetical protein